jgi:transposase
VPEVRRLLRLLAHPAEQRGFLLHWSRWRRAHQAGARRGHVARRARARPTPPPCPPRAPEPQPPPGAQPLWTALSDAQWTRVQPLLPPKAPVGRPPCDDRVVLAGILWVLRTGAGWRALPPAFGPWHTIYSRYHRWRLAGLWPQLVRDLQDPTTTTQDVSL